MIVVVVSCIGRQCSNVSAEKAIVPCDDISFYLTEHIVQHVAHDLLSYYDRTYCPKLTTDLVRRSFSCAAFVTWNSFPVDLIMCDSNFDH